jgi:2-dehydropantoate 2-reductase
MRIVALGAGGVGGYFGARLAGAGAAVTVVARGAHLEAIRRDGLRVTSSVEGDWVVRVEAVDTLQGQPAADAVLLCVKAFDTDEALRLVRPVVGPDTPVLSLQNGLEGVEMIDTVLGPGHALGGAAYVFASIERPGVIVHRFAGKIALGELDGRRSPRVQRLHDAFARAGVPVELASDIARVMWEKYLLICAQAGLTAVTGVPIGVIRETPETWRLYRRIVEELATLAGAAGVKLAPDVVDSVVAAARGLAPEARSSLAHDLGQGKRLELEALHGYAVRLGERLGVSLPSVFAVYAALKPHASGRRPAAGEEASSRRA